MEKLKTIKNKKTIIFLFLLTIAVLIIYAFFCPNDKFTLKNAAGLVIVSLVSIILLAFVDPKNKYIKNAAGVFLMIATPFFAARFILCDTMIKSTQNYWIEIIILTALMLFALIFIRRTAAAAGFCALFCALFVLLNELALCFRKSAIIPTDIFSLGTAFAVSGQYPYQFTYKTLSAVLTAVALVAVLIRFDVELRVKKFSTAKNAVINILLTFIPIALIALGVKYINSVNIKNIDPFDVSVSNKNAGTATTFVHNIKTMFVEAPPDYSNKTAEQILSGYTPEAADKDFIRPNVIVIMNEALSDMDTFCGIGKKEQFFPFLSQPHENMKKGYAQVSVFGGNTANSEFEFLTGNSLYFMPQGYIPYMRTITRATPSFVSDVEKLGYKTLAIHPYMPQCWRRSGVYPMLGFDEFVSGPDFDKNHKTTASNMRGKVDFGDVKYLRNYISDEADFDMIMSKLEEKDKDDRMFIFNVTMQNHGSYLYKEEDFEEYLAKGSFDLDPNITAYDEIVQYLTLIRETDASFEQLLNKLEAFDEPTVVLMFGDHLPGFAAVNESLEGRTAAERQSKYYVPYFMWANFDIPEEENEKPVSLAFLCNDLKKTVGMPLTSWDMLREAVREQYPSMNAYGTFDTDYNWVKKSEDPKGILHDYYVAEYGHLFKGVE